MAWDAVPLSVYGAASSSPAPVNQMMAAFAEDFRDGLDINLGVGYVNEGTIPHAAMQEALDHVLAHPEKHRQSFNYGGPLGSRNLIESIRRFHQTPEGGAVPEDVLARNTIIIGPSGATSILDGIAQIIEPGIVLTSDPMYYIYCDYLERKGFEIVTAPEDAHGISPEAMEEAIQRLGDRRHAIRFIYVVTINNPSCSILSNARRAALVRLAERLSHDLNRPVPLVLDAAYELLVHDAAVGPLESALIHDRHGLVYQIGTLSKIFAPALRIGYLIGRDGPFLRALVQRTSDVGFSAPLVTQEMATYLLDHCAVEQQRRVNAGYREKAQRTQAALREHLGDHLSECIGGNAGFYLYLTFKDAATDRGSPFFRYLARTTGDVALDGPPEDLRPRVVYLPGEICVHSRGPLREKGLRQLRLSYGYEDIARIEEAIAYMKDATRYSG